jgi:hypothetical protein
MTGCESAAYWAAVVEAFQEDPKVLNVAMAALTMAEAAE